MAKRRTKKRTHKKISEEELASIPKSMVIHLGSSLKNHSLSQLVSDVRNVMQPHTAINLRERKSNKLKDFIVMCGPLHVSDLLIFNQSESGNITLRIGKLPRGPNLQFKINSYSLCKDIHKILRHPKSISKDSSIFHMPPLLVLNGFGKVSEMSQHEKLMVTMFQNMFPPIQPQSTNVSSIKRVLLISKNKETNEIEFRHYAINTKLVEENRNVKKLIQSHHNLKKNLPRLTKNKDVSELLLDPYSVGGLTSDSEVEDDAVVEIQQESLVKKEEPKQSVGDDQEEEEQQQQQQEPVVAKTKRAIKLTELGPRINMTLMKIEEGLVGSSKTLYHASIKKSEEEIKSLEKKHQLKQQLKQERRAKQQAAVQAKLDIKEAKKARRKARKEGGSGEGDQEDEEMANQSDDQEESEDENEVEINPEDYENDSDLYSDVEV
ncbi:conserved hypothetical protein [Candida tropicalis MYA-3404]|uniref:Brix domain-containing protein n=1 Tax=Candida tropicalis (strain ATCC MYA-3404 / T1) TaxID=294747 RepID=C5MIJ1_CANTT|nr:conserved hypothetical protein [Candida tropicalis MYA-3404]EER30485.1 conserved hypothetical protein [Candida tropicalis MYA-3404]KAG4406348.1 hypothetical protein JTP64_003732 [Candida tropicalis]